MICTLLSTHGELSFNTAENNKNGPQMTDLDRLKFNSALLDP